MRGTRFVVVAMGTAPCIVLPWRAGVGPVLSTFGALSWRLPPAPVPHERLAGSRLRAAGVLDPTAVGRPGAEHLSGARDHAPILWALPVFESGRTHYLGEGALV